MIKTKDKDNYYSVTEASKILDISRTAVLKRINTGKLKAERIGHIFAIPKNELGIEGSERLSDKEKEIIEAGISKTIEEYSEVLEKLAKV